MEENFDVYYCSVCHTCKKPLLSKENMKFCSACKLIQYCCAEHQKKDWRNHKDLCKSVQLIVKNVKEGDHIFAAAPLLGPGNSVGWNDMRMTVVNVLKNFLKRSLSTLEMQMILFPPVCSYCHQYKVNEMFVCVCKSVVYCCEDHQCADDNHKSLCKYFSQSFKLDMLRLKRPICIFRLISLLNKCSLRRFPGDMETYLKSIHPRMTDDELLLSDMISYSLTLIYVISKVAKINSNQVTVHMVGSEVMELIAMQTFPLIYHLLPHVIHLTVVLIGMSIPDDDTIPLCLDESNVSLSSVNLKYHEYAKSEKFATPDIIIAYNCGFCEFAKIPETDMWKPSLPSILSFKNTTVVITSYTKKEAEEDIERLIHCKPDDSDYKTLIKAQPNPFASLYPRRDWESEGICYCNKYISVLRT